MKRSALWDCAPATLYGTLASALVENHRDRHRAVREGIASLAFEEAEAERLRDAVAHQRQADCAAIAGAGGGRGAISPQRHPASAPCLRRDGAVDRACAGARVCAPMLTAAGAHTLDARVTRLNTILGRATGVETTAGKIKAEHVVIAAGAWSTQIEHLPRRLPGRASPRQMAAAPWPADMPRTVLYYDRGYVLARGGEAIFGSTMEYVGFDGGVTPDWNRGDRRGGLNACSLNLPSSRRRRGRGYDR